MRGLGRLGMCRLRQLGWLRSIVSREGHAGIVPLVTPAQAGVHAGAATQRDSQGRANGDMDCPLRVPFGPRFRGNDERGEGRHTVAPRTASLCLCVSVVNPLLAAEKPYDGSPSP